jgi:hypothetical protein
MVYVIDASVAPVAFCIVNVAWCEGSTCRSESNFTWAVWTAVFFAPVVKSFRVNLSVAVCFVVDATFTVDVSRRRDEPVAAIKL